VNLLTTVLTPFIPLAAEWAEEQEAISLRKGRPLTSHQRDDARAAGVTQPERIRVKVVRTIKPPDHLLLGLANRFSKSLGPDDRGP
jgi:hypothetical protein